jgi:hypothetical protein
MADADGQRPHARRAVALDVRGVVGLQDADDEQPGKEAEPERGGVERVPVSAV